MKSRLLQHLVHVSPSWPTLTRRGKLRCPGQHDMIPQHTSMAPKLGVPSCPHAPTEPELWGSPDHLVPTGRRGQDVVGGPARCPLNSGLAARPLGCPPVPPLQLQHAPSPKSVSVCPCTIQPLRFPACPQLLCPLSTPTSQFVIADPSGPHHPTQYTCHHWSLRSQQVSAAPHRVLMGTEVAAMPVSTEQEETEAQ